MTFGKSGAIASAINSFVTWTTSPPKNNRSTLSKTLSIRIWRLRVSCCRYAAVRVVCSYECD